MNKRTDNMKEKYMKPTIKIQQVILEHAIAGSTPVGPSGTTPTIEDWDEDGTGIGDNWGASQEWNW